MGSCAPRRPSPARTESRSGTGPSSSSTCSSPAGSRGRSDGLAGRRSTWPTLRRPRLRGLRRRGRRRSPVLPDIPVVLMLVGLAAYTVLAGADFGAGFWTLLPGGGRASAPATRDHARHAMGSVWEANHVWLIFVLVVCWTAYPVAFASITSTLSVPLFIAAVGVILRGASYALRGQLDSSSGRRAVECVFALSSIMTPFALGTVVGAIASGRVPVGNARGDMFGSWLNPTSLVIGTLAIATSSYLA